jgi:hypothetical protein
MSRPYSVRQPGRVEIVTGDMHLYLRMQDKFQKRELFDLFGTPVWTVESTDCFVDSNDSMNNKFTIVLREVMPIEFGSQRPGGTIDG